MLDKLKKVYRRELLKRSQLLRIAAAWVITVLVSVLLAAMVFYGLRSLVCAAAG